MNEFLAILIYLLCICLFITIALSINKLLSPQRRESEVANNEPFECGAIPFQKSNLTKIPISYYKVAIMFILFDLEGIFLYLWSLAAKPMTNFMMITFLLFMVILVAIFIYILKEGLINFMEIKSKGKVKVL